MDHKLNSVKSIHQQYSTLLQSLICCNWFLHQMVGEKAWALLPVLKNTGRTVGQLYAAMPLHGICVKTGRLNYKVM